MPTRLATAGTQITEAERSAYLGLSGDVAVAGAFLLLPGGDTPTIWLKRSAATPPTALHEDALSAAGWQQVVTHYDAGVTRQHRH